MITAQAGSMVNVTLSGIHIDIQIGTGGHGDSQSSYAVTYHRRPSIIRLDDDETDTEDKKRHVNIASDINELSPLICRELVLVGLGEYKVQCFDLMRWNAEGNEHKSGAAFVVGRIEARLISGKASFFVDGKQKRQLRIADARNNGE